MEEFERLGLPERRFELDAGELAEREWPTFRHNAVAGQVFFLLHRFVTANGIGEVLFPGSGFVLGRGPDTLRGPDVAFLRSERAALIDPDSSRFEGAPDLAVEVVSPSDSAAGINRKVEQYLRAGAALVWVVYPGTRQVHVFSGGGSIAVLHEADTVTAPEVLPGFTAAVRSFFE